MSCACTGAAGGMCLAWSGSGPGSLRFRHEPRLAQTRVWCWDSLLVSPGGKGTSSWIRGLVVSMGYQHLDLEYRVCVGSVSEGTTSIVVCLYVGCECFYVYA
ncbi:hypothetical protein ILYODFUR_031506 [Ilyodon furcidens]|uniref:Secreted protein n=1 Tax=Ilyodon furcidens TaxID=33524 RepID=A0ABV0UWT6_9TELE